MKEAIKLAEKNIYRFRCKDTEEHLVEILGKPEDFEKSDEMFCIWCGKKGLIFSGAETSLDQMVQVLKRENEKYS
ncbi:MAG: hypothetical protein PHY72_01385 [Candidatus Pacebacteria bacterium]|nr:hypothetical protein [Candidatus Paceibacterota bacterium]